MSEISRIKENASEESYSSIAFIVGVKTNSKNEQIAVVQNQRAAQGQQRLHTGTQHTTPLSPSGNKKEPMKAKFNMTSSNPKTTTDKQEQEPAMVAAPQLTLPAVTADKPETKENETKEGKIKPKTVQLQKLSRDEKASLAKQEAIVEKYFNDYWVAAKALHVIHQERLYRATHTSFKAYCAERWEFERAHANRLVKAVPIYLALEPLKSDTLPLPTSEFQLRPLTKLAADDYVTVWEKAVTAAGGKPVTHNIVLAAVNEHLGVQAPTTKPAPAQPAETADTPGEKPPLVETLSRLEELLKDYENAEIQAALQTLKTLCGLKVEGNQLK